jgi:glutamate-1-semialdehyde 2,1-aminomutase
LSASPELARLRERELRRFEAASPESRRLHREAAAVLSGGVASSFQRAAPWPLHLVSGTGATVTDADGVGRIDFHNGFGAMVQGHAHPAVVAAVEARAHQGTHFAAPGEDAAVVAAELARRFGLPRWRFVNSGSEAALDAIRIARGLTGRETVVEAEGAYHGLAATALAGRERVPFDDVPALEAKLGELAEAGRPAACVILEPALMLGCVEPSPGYLAEVRALTARRAVPLIFDEVKTGLSIAAGGAAERYGVRPDLIAVGKALGGGLPSAAVGGSEEAMAAVEDGRVAQAGTYNGNPLAMAAARASLFEVLTPVAYERFERLGRRLAVACEEALAARGWPGRAPTLGARGAFVFAGAPIRDDSDFRAARRPASENLLWLYAANRGLYLTPARPQNWTLSVAHDEAAVDRYTGVLEELLGELRAGTADLARPA